MSIEQTLILAKPDAVERGLVGEIISRFEQSGLQLIGAKMMQISRELAEQHYAEHVEKPFFQGLVDFIISTPVVAMVWQGENAVLAARTTMGATDPAKADKGTIRGDLASDIEHNLVHGADSPERAQVEISFYFKPEEILDWKQSRARA